MTQILFRLFNTILVKGIKISLQKIVFLTSLCSFLNTFQNQDFDKKKSLCKKLLTRCSTFNLNPLFQNFINLQPPYISSKEKPQNFDSKYLHMFITQNSTAYN
jgi:hypothetical protein